MCNFDYNSFKMETNFIMYVTSDALSTYKRDSANIRMLVVSLVRCLERDRAAHCHHYATDAQEYLKRHARKNSN